ncbi:MAG: multiheme c-type cytochrome [Vicinamibacterales bacterium]
MKLIRIVCQIVAGLVVGTCVAHAQSASRCADCHFANPSSVSTTHLAEWDLSAHGRNKVGCETCHGGDPRSFEPFVAHRGILARTNPASPVYRSNEPATCGTCHQGPFAAFKRSRHYDLLTSGDPEVPNCATCHGEVAGLRPSPAALEARCQQCHGPRARAPRPEFAARGRQAFEGLRETRALLSDIRRTIARVKDPARKAALTREADLAERPIIDATGEAHAYMYDHLDEWLAQARTRLSRLFDRVANPEAR